jgi:hypothetical protein
MEFLTILLVRQGCRLLSGHFSKLSLFVGCIKNNFLLGYFTVLPLQVKLCSSDSRLSNR